MTTTPTPWTRFLRWYGETFGSEKYIIKQQWGDEEYLTRYTLRGKRFGGKPNLFLHRFHRSDYDAPHNHPWPFTSLILAGGYWEKTPRIKWQHGRCYPAMKRLWYGPGRILVRPASWRHSVEIPEDGREVWTLVQTGSKIGSWGFFCGPLWDTYKNWQQHFIRMKETGHGCD